MSSAFTTEYVQSHRQQIHTYDSFGRTLSELILRAIENKMKEAPVSGPVKLAAEITVEPIAKTNANELVCVDVQVCLPIVGCTSIHVGVCP